MPATRPDQELELTLATLRESEARFYRLAENAPDVIFHLELTPRRRVSFVNAAVTRITGYTPEELYADPWLADRLIHEADIPLIRSGSDQPIRTFHKDGRVVWLECHTITLPGADGRPAALEVIARDVTARVTAEAAARRAQDQLTLQTTLLARLEERESLAADMNDGAIQSLYGVMLQLEGEARRAASPEAAAMLREVSDQLREVIEEIRRHLAAGSHLRPRDWAVSQATPPARAARHG